MNSVTQANYQSEVLQSSIPVIIDMYTITCEPCKRLTPVIEQIAIEKSGVVKIMKMNCQDEPGIASQLSIRGVPALLMFNRGAVHSFLSGEKSKADIVRWIDEGLAGI